MVVQPDMMDRMVDAGARLPEKEVIRFMLKHKGSGVLDGSSPNTWFMHVSDFLWVGAYDEDYAGNKGWSDVQLLDIVKSFFKVHHRADLFVDFYSVNEVSDSMVTSLDRSHAANRKLRLRKLSWVRRKGGWKAFLKADRTRIRFPWTKIL